MVKEKWQAGINICNLYHKPINTYYLIINDWPNRKISKQYAQTVVENETQIT